MAGEGWVCPRCGIVHAPWVPRCSCAYVEPPEGWAHCYCPTCGRVTTVPSDGPHDLPWCTHHDAAFPWRAGGAESGWTAMKPCIALAEEAQTHTTPTRCSA